MDESANSAPFDHPLHGTWKMVRAVFYSGEIADRGHYTFAFKLGDPQNLLTLRGTHGPNADRAIPAIFQRKGELLRICYGLDGTIPVVFASPAGSQLYLVTYRRKL
jgi:hypothetical protein